MADSASVSDFSPTPKPGPGLPKAWLWAGVALLAFAGMMVVVMIFAARNAKNIGKQYLLDGAVRAIDASSVAPSEKSADIAGVTDFLDRAVADQIPQAQVDKITQIIMAGHYGKQLQLAGALHAIDKSDLAKGDKADAQEQIQLLSGAFGHGLVSDAELAPILASIPQAAQGRPASPPWTGAQVQQLRDQAAGVGGGFRSVRLIAAIRHAVEKSALAKPALAAALGDVRALDNAYSWKLISDADLAPVLAAVPVDKDGKPAALPWKPDDLKLVMARIDAVGGGYPTLAKLETINQAIDRADPGVSWSESFVNFFKGITETSSSESIQARLVMKKLAIGWARKSVTDAELAGVPAAMPLDKEGKPAPPPWSDADLKKVLAAAGAAVQGKDIKPDNLIGDYPDDIRAAVKAMKDAMASGPGPASAPAGTQP